MMAPTTVRTKTYLKHAITGSLWRPHLPLASTPLPYPECKIVWEKIFYRGAVKSLARPGRKQAISMSKSSWMMDPTRSREMPSCSNIDLAEIGRSSKISSWIWSIISRVVGLRTYQHPGISYHTKMHVLVFIRNVLVPSSAPQKMHQLEKWNKFHLF